VPTSTPTGRPAHHVFTYANAVHRMLKRIEGTDWDGHFEAEGGILHGVMALYLARYINAPPARIPGGGGESGTSGITLPTQRASRGKGICRVFHPAQHPQPQLGDGYLGHFGSTTSILPDTNSASS
jgi:hypothetical protein